MRHRCVYLSFVLQIAAFGNCIIVSVFPNTSRTTYDVEAIGRALSGEGNGTQKPLNRRGVTFDGLDDEALRKYSCGFPTEEKGGGLIVSSCDFTFLPPGDLSQPQPWSLGVGKNAFWLGGPTKDTDGSASGGYAFVDAAAFRRSGPATLAGEARAWLATTVYPSTGPEGRCFKFSVSTSGAAIQILRVHLVQLYPLDPQVRRTYRSAFGSPFISHAEDILKSLPNGRIFNHSGNWREMSFPVYLQDGQVAADWSKKVLTYSSAYPHGFLFEAVVNLKEQQGGFVAVDNVELGGQACPGECEFNYDFCDWELEGGDFEWSIGRGTTNFQTGPTTDQATSAGYPSGGGYAFVDSSYPRKTGHKAVLVSPQFSVSNATNPKCLSFWLNMYGKGIGKLRVLRLESKNDGNKRTRNAIRNTSNEVLWELGENGPQNLWYRAQVTIVSNASFKVAFEATVGEPGFSDIAIDSITIDDEPCPILPQNAAPGKRSNLDCTFLENTCNWQLRLSQLVRQPQGFTPIFPAAFNPLWSRVGSVDGYLPGRKQSLDAAPNPYASFRTVPASTFDPAARGYMVSSQIDGVSEAMCISFWALISAVDDRKFGGLEVLVCQPPVHRLDYCASIWRLNNHQKRHWFYAQASFTPALNGSILVISGVQGDGGRGNVGVDDIVVFRGNCSTLPELAAVATGDCFFDNGMCGWAVDDLSLPQPSTTISSTTTNPSITTTPSETTTASVSQEMSSTVKSPASSATPATVSTDSTTGLKPTSLVPESMTSTVVTATSESSNVSSAGDSPTSSAIPTTVSTDSPTGFTTLVQESSASTVIPATADSSTVSSASTTISNASTPSATSASTIATTSTSTTSESPQSRTEAELLLTDVRGRERGGRIMNKWRVNSNPFGDETGRSATVNTGRQNLPNPTFSANNPGNIKFGYNPYTAYFSYVPFQSGPGQQAYNWHSASSGYTSLSSDTRNASVQDKVSPGVTPVFNPLKPVFAVHGTGSSSAVRNKQTRLPGVASFQYDSDITQFESGAVQQKLVPIPPVQVAHDVMNFAGGYTTRGRGWQIAHPTEVTLATHDHTFGIANGAFAYFDSSNATRLISPYGLFSGNAGKCLEFYFAEFGPVAVRTLLVKRLTKDGQPETLWSVRESSQGSGPYGQRQIPSWRFGQVWIEAETTVIFFEGSSDRGGFALDDVLLRLLEKNFCKGIAMTSYYKENGINGRAPQPLSMYGNVMHRNPAAEVPYSNGNYGVKREEIISVGATTDKNGMDPVGTKHQAPQEDTPEIDITISNVVCSYSVKCHLNLKMIAMSGANVEFRRENAMLTMKLRKPHVTASIWSSGHVTVTGSTSEPEARVAARRVARILQKQGYKVRLSNYRVVNVLGSCTMPWAIKILLFSGEHREVSYEPELHPGATYRIADPKATLKIFSTGSITVTAPSVENVQRAIEHVYPMVHPFRTERSQKEKERLARGIKRKREGSHGVDETEEEEEVDSDEEVISAFQ